MSLGRPIRHREKGQAVILITLSLVVTLGMLGMVVDIGWAYFRRMACKTAAESAAHAAAAAASVATGFTCGLTVPCNSSQTACPASPTSPPSDYLQSGCLYAKQNGYINSGSQTVTYASGTSTAPATGVNPAYWISFTVSENLPQLFSAVLGKNMATVSVRSVTGVYLDQYGACIYGLNPTAPDTILATGSSNTQSACGIYDNSSDSVALEAKGGGVLNASTVRIVGNYSTSGGGTVNPAPSTGQSPIPDPFASVPAPSIPARCDSIGFNNNFTPTMPADGKYVICGDVRITGNATQTYPAGIYIVKGGINWGSNGTVRGTGVTFYVTSTNYSGVNINGGADVQLSAPTTGTYRGMLFFQDRTLVSPPDSNFVGGTNQILNGSLYFPTTMVTYTGGSSTTASYTAIVADRVTLKGNSYFTADVNGQHTGLGLPKIGIFE